MSRWGKPTKNKKRIDPRYFLNEKQDQLERNLEYIRKTNEKTKQIYAKIEKMEQEFEKKSAEMERIAAEKDKEYAAAIKQKDKEYAEEKERQQKILMKKRAEQLEDSNKKSLRMQKMSNAGYNINGVYRAISAFLEKKYTEIVVSQNWDKAVKFLKTKGDIFAKMKKIDDNTNWQDYDSLIDSQKQYLDLAKQLGVPYTLTKHFTFAEEIKDE